MAKTYFEWFQEKFSVDQSSLVNTLLKNNGTVSLQLYFCPEYYIEGFDIYIKDEEAKSELFQKHEERLDAEKKILFRLIQNAEFQDANTFINESNLKKMKECIQEIEIQTEIINLINSKLHTVFSTCMWFPFNSRILFDIFYSIKMPLINYGSSYWIGILPDLKNYIRQKNFFECLQALEIPQDSNLILTKLKTELVNVNSKLKENDQEYIKNLYEEFKKNAIKDSKEKIFQSWDSINYLNNKIKK